VRLAALLLALAALLAVAGTAAADDGWTPIGMEQELMCPTCKTRLDLSHEPAANQIRAALRRAKAQGLSKGEVERRLVADYGEAVLASPPRDGIGWAAWLIPAAVLAGGAAAAVWLAARWRAGRSEGSAALDAPLAPAPAGDRVRLEQQLDAELERFE